MPHRFFDSCRTRERPVHAHELLDDGTWEVPQDVREHILWTLNRVRDRVKVPLLAQIANRNAFDSFLAQSTSKASRPLPGHWIGCGRDPIAIKTSSVCAVLDTDLVRLYYLHNGFDRDFGRVSQSLQNIRGIRIEIEGAAKGLEGLPQLQWSFRDSPAGNE